VSKPFLIGVDLGTMGTKAAACRRERPLQPTLAIRPPACWAPLWLSRGPYHRNNLNHKPEKE
jgi:hypothetical protein